MATAEQIRAAMEAHAAAVGRADAPALAMLYAADGRVYDPAGSEPVVGRAAVAEHFRRFLTERRDIEIVMIAVTGHDAAMHFRATPAGGVARDVVDTMTFDDDGLILAMRAYAN
jgi:steroid delta-isomerase